MKVADLKKATKRKVLRLGTAGLATGRPPIKFYPARTSCGNIYDGVALDLGADFAGEWVISYKDLERMYFAARSARLALSTPCIE